MNIAKPVCNFLRRNGSLILSVTASVGVVATAYLTGEAVIKADKLLNEKPVNKKEIVKAYIPPVASGTATIACIIGCHIMNQKIQAGLLAAYGVLNSTFQAYKSKLDVEDQLRIERDIAKDRIDAEIEKLLELRPDEEYELWVDDYRKHPFWARKSDILLGKDEVNKDLSDCNFSRHYGCGTLETFYSHVQGDIEPQDCLRAWDIDYLWGEWETDRVDIEWTDDIYIDPGSGKKIPCNHIWWSVPPLMNYWNYDTMRNGDEKEFETWLRENS